jgi:hypothetical protein
VPWCKAEKLGEKRHKVKLNLADLEGTQEFGITILGTPERSLYIAPKSSCHLCSEKLP